MRNSPSADQPDPEPVSRIDVPQTHEEILEYWTEQRMAEAKPREIRLPPEGPHPKQRGGDASPSNSDTTEAEP